MGQIEAAEDAVPVGVVALTLVEVFERVPLRADGVDFPRNHDHPLVKAARLRVLEEEFAEEPAAQEPAGFRAGPGLELLEGRLVVGLEDPLHHFFVGRRRKIDPARGRMRVQILGKGHRPDALVFDVGEEPLEPAFLEHPFVGARPDAEFLAVVPEDGRPARSPEPVEMGVDVVEAVERHEVAELFVDRKKPQTSALFLGDIGRSQVADPGIVKMLFVEEGVFDARRRQGFGQVGLPDSFGEPQPPRRLSEILPEVVVHHPDLPDPVLFGNDRQDGFVEASAQELDLPPAGQFLDEVPTGPLVLFHVLPERAGEVESEAEARMPGQALEQRPVAVLECVLDDVVEIPHRLVVVDGEQEDELVHSSSSTRIG